MKTERIYTRTAIGLCIFIALVGLVLEYGKVRTTYPIHIHDTETVSIEKNYD